jgi:hypothetical protein
MSVTAGFTWEDLPPTDRSAWESFRIPLAAAGRWALAGEL